MLPFIRPYAKGGEKKPSRTCVGSFCLKNRDRLRGKWPFNGKILPRVAGRRPARDGKKYGEKMIWNVL